MHTTIEQFKAQYPVDQTTFAVGNHRLELFVPQNIDTFVNQADVLADFPLWSKIWEATAVLASHLLTLEVRRGARFLEIGAGMGVAGLCAARMGHQVTITEYNGDALNFARANARLNDLDPDMVVRLDWNAPRLAGQFDYIIGSEVVFKETDYPALFFLFQKYLSPGGTIILAEGMRKTALHFVQKMEAHYRIRLKKQTLTVNAKEVVVILMEMTARPGAPTQ